MKYFLCLLDRNLSLNIVLSNIDQYVIKLYCFQSLLSRKKSMTFGRVSTGQKFIHVSIVYQKMCCNLTGTILLFYYSYCVTLFHCMLRVQRTTCNLTSSNYKSLLSTRKQSNVTSFQASGKISHSNYLFLTLIFFT